MSAAASCPFPLTVEMTISDGYLYSETQIESLAMKLHDDPLIQVVSFRVLHLAGALAPNPNSSLDERYNMLATVIPIEVPAIAHVGRYYYNNLAVTMLTQLCREMGSCKAHHLH